MSPKTLIQTEIDSKLRVALDQLQKDHDTQLPELKGLVDRLGKAIEKGDGAMIELYREPFVEHLKYAGSLVNRATKLKEDLKKLKPQTADDLKAVETIIGKVSKLSTTLDQNFVRLKAGQDKMNDALAKVAGSANRFGEEWAKMEELLDQHVANCNWRVKQLTGFLEKAKASIADRDLPKLNEWIASASKAREGNPKHVDVETAFKKFTEKSKSSGLDQNAKDQLARDLPALKQSFDSTTTLEGSISKLTMEIKGLSMKPVDKKKATTLLKIPPKLAQDFQDALGLKAASMEKALNDVGSQLTPKQTGKDMIAALKKAKIL
ncbi:MAG TPA: hypothetical protein VK843_03105 [Planctomycetota bacterium]|nr:hypothetical protein [Planctomycetota bacterium]